jgi:DNA-binding IclR family transcriptional regulator
MFNHLDGRRLAEIIEHVPSDEEHALSARDIARESGLTPNSAVRTLQAGVHVGLIAERFERAHDSSWLRARYWRR